MEKMNMNVKTYEITHLTILAHDEVKMRAFYRDLFNAVEEKTGASQYSYAFTAAEDPFLTLQFGGQAQSERQEGMYHFALLFPSAAELGALVQRLLAAQYPMGAGDHQVSEAIYLDDPNGNGIELYRDRTADKWAWHDGQVEMGTYDMDVHALLGKVDHIWHGFPIGMKIGHLYFSGRDLAVADNFFNNVLQLDTVLDIPENAHFYSHNRYHHHHAFNIWSGHALVPKKRNEQGLIAWQVNVDSVYFEMLRSNLGNLIERGEETQNTLVIPDVVGCQLTIIGKD